ncbi:MAG TPA: DUF6328 family protein [Microthrixaceae bacterium]|nr:DUF6328 family protein [Microthrixaceae bacterium]
MAIDAPSSRTEGPAPPKDDLPDLPASRLDDVRDRDELRRRYYGLMQELRVLLPGVQILVAFLLTAPFAQRFTELDSTGRTMYAVALGSGCTAVLLFVTPTALHRVGRRTARSSRLQWSINLTRAGLAAFAIALTSSLMVVARIVYSDAVSIVVGCVAAAVFAVAWLVFPIASSHDDD